MGDGETTEAGVQVQPDSEEKTTRKRQAKRPVTAVGRTVHYITDSGKPRPATIIEVHDVDLVDIVIFNSLGAIPKEDVEFSEEPQSGRWTWPPRD